MPVSTRKQKQQQEQEHGYSPTEDRVSECVRMYPVFCTANIPSKILDEFIDEAYKGWFDLVDDPNSSGASPCILQTTDLDSITHGSRKPMSDFESPFLNMTESEIRDWMLKHRHPEFARATFTILDQNTVDRKICRMGYIGGKNCDTRMLCTEFYVDLYIRAPIEMGTVGWDDEQLAADGRVYSRKVIEDNAKAIE